MSARMTVRVYFWARAQGMSPSKAWSFACEPYSAGIMKFQLNATYGKLGRPFNFPATAN